MNTKPGIGYHAPVQLMSQKSIIGKYVGLVVSLLTILLFVYSKQYILLIWSFFLAGFILEQLYRLWKVKKTLADQQDALTDYVHTAIFYGSIENENITFKMSDLSIKNLCSFDSINHADELLRTIIVCKSGQIYMRIRLIYREKIYAQVRQIPAEVATDLWVASQKAKALAEGRNSPFNDDID